MTENIKKLLELASENEELRNRLSNVTKDETIAIAKENGITLTDADFEQGNEISDDELDAVAGGKYCVCIFSGCGRKSKHDKSCFCTIGGYGKHTDGNRRCLCAYAGEGDSGEE